MNKHYDDHKIASDFSQLRQVELGLAPRFSSLLKAANGSKPRSSLLHPKIGFAVAVLTLSILTVILLRPDNNGSIPDSLNNQPYSTDSMQLSLLDEMPTDFLLETPWSQLASLGPEDQLLGLPYEFLEELPDES